MKILKLDITEFGVLTDVHYELSEGLNIFEGDNESGKSTLWLFIKFMLYGIPKKGNPEREKAINRSTHTASGSMTLLWKDKEYRIERSFAEGSRFVKTYIYSVGGEKLDFDGKEPGEVILGVPKDVFENSSCIGQSLCRGLGGEKGAAAIKNILSSADESVDIEKIEKKLDAIRVEYKHKNGKGGKLYGLSEKISSLQGRLDRATESRLRISDTEEKLKKNASLLKENEKVLAEYRELLGQLQKLEVLRRFDSLQKNEEAYRELCRNMDSLVSSEQENGYLPTSADAAELYTLSGSAERAESDLEAQRKRLELYESKTNYNASLAEVGEKLESIGGKDSVLSAFKDASKKAGAGVTIIIVASVLAAAGAIFVGFLLPLGIALIAVSAALMATGVAVYTKFNGNKKKICNEYGKKSEELEKYISDCADAYRAKLGYENLIYGVRSDLRSSENHRNQLFEQLGRAVRKTSSTAPVTVDGARGEAERIGAFLRRQTELRRRIEQLEGLIINDKKILSVYDEEQIRHGFTVDISELEKIDVGDVEHKERFYAEKVRKQKELDENLRTQLISDKAVSEDPSVISDRIAELKSQYAAADKYYESVMTAIDGLQRAAAALQGNITPAISRNAGSMMEYISGGKYASVNMSRDMAIDLVGEDGLTTTGNMMSGGTGDAAYLALRISLMMQLYGGNMPPLMLDETFCQLDDTRMKRILGLVAKLCDNGLQGIIFTCHRRESAACADMGLRAKLFEM